MAKDYTIELYHANAKTFNTPNARSDFTIRGMPGRLSLAKYVGIRADKIDHQGAGGIAKAGFYAV
jgi:hypothetical protein